VSVPALQVYPGTYRDSLLLMSATRAMADGPGVSWAGAVMATPAAIEDLSARGFAPARASKPCSSTGSSARPAWP
jgi:FdrA protein